VRLKQDHRTLRNSGQFKDPCASSTSCSPTRRYFQVMSTSGEEFAVLAHLRAALRLATTSAEVMSLSAFVSTTQPMRCPSTFSMTTKSGLYSRPSEVHLMGTSLMCRRAHTTTFLPLSIALAALNSGAVSNQAWL